MSGFKITTPKAKCEHCKKPITMKRGWHGSSDGRYSHMDCRLKWLDKIVSRPSGGTR